MRTEAPRLLLVLEEAFAGLEFDRTDPPCERLCQR